MSGLDRDRVMLGISLVLSAAFIVSGVPKVIGMEMPVMEFAVWLYPDWLRILVGILEITGAAMLLYRPTVVFAVIPLAAVILGAAYTHWVNDEARELFRPLLYGSLLVVVVWHGHTRANGSG